MCQNYICCTFLWWHHTEHNVQQYIIDCIVTVAWYVVVEC